MKPVLVLCSLFAAASGNAVAIVDDIDATSCGRDSEFSASILIEHEIVDPEKVDNTELEYLAKAFASVYNGLNTPNANDVVCDTAFLRYAVTPQVEAKDIFYRDLPDGGRRARQNFLYTMKMTGIGVSPETPVFDVGTPRWELLTEDTPGNEASTTDNKKKHNTCSCAPTAEPRAPTAEEFRSGFNTFIQNLEAFGKLNNIHTANYVTDLKNVACDSEEHEFQVNTVFDLQTSSMDSVDLIQLTNNFKDSYNELVNSYCDPCFRTIESVSIETAKKGLKGSKIDERLKASVKGKSRCADTSSLFDSVQRRLVPTLEPSEEHGGRLVDNNKCYCPSHSTASRAPTALEFTEAFNRISTVTSHAQVAQVIEQ